MSVFSIPETLKWHGALKPLAAKWPDILRRVRAIEESLGLPEPPCPGRYTPEPRRGVMVGISLEDRDTFEELIALNSEWNWVRARLAAIATALDTSAGVVQLNQRRRGRAA